MIGMEFDQPIKEKRAKLLFDEKVFTGATGTHVFRLLPPLCLSVEQVKVFLERFRNIL
jgi:acetylornithine aminotransferase